MASTAGGRREHQKPEAPGQHPKPPVSAPRLLELARLGRAAALEKLPLEVVELGVVLLGQLEGRAEPRAAVQRPVAAQAEPLL